MPEVGADFRKRSCPSKNSSRPKENEFRVVVSAPLQLRKAVGRGESGLRRLFDNNQSIGREPSAGARRDERRGGKVVPVGRIEEGEGEGLNRMSGTEPGRVAAENECR